MDEMLDARDEDPTGAAGNPGETPAPAGGVPAGPLDRVLGAFLEAATGAALVLDTTGQIVAANEAMANRLRSAPSALAGRSFAEAVGPGRAEDELRAVAEVFRTGNGVTLEHRRAGLELVTRVRPVRDADGSVPFAVLVSMDVTESKRVESELRSEVSFRRAVTTCLGVGLAAVDAEGRQVFVNPAFCEMVGYSQEELLGQTPPFPYWPPDQHEEIARVFREQTAGAGHGPSRDVPFRRKDGSRLVVHVSASPLVQEGEPIGWLGSVVDVTPRVKAKEALRQSESRLRLSLDAARAGIWAWRGGDDPGYWSEGSYRIHGLDPSTPGRPIDLAFATMHPDEREHRFDVGWIRSAEPRRVDLSYRVLLPDGSTRWVRDLGEPELGPDGTLLGYAGIKLDVTESVEAQEALRRSELKTRTVIETAMAPFVLFDVTGRVLEVNDATSRLLALPRDEMTGKTIADFVVDAGAEQVDARIADALAHGGVQFDCRLKAADGRTIDVEVSLSSLEVDGGRLVCFLHDVTGSKAATTALALERSDLAARVTERTAELSNAIEELARASRLKDEFLASTSHELRSPLTSILGICDLLLAGGRGTLSEAQARAVGMVQESGRHLLALITDILDVSKIEAGRLDLALGWVDLNGVCEAALSLVTPTAVQKRHGLSLRTPSGRTLLRADERRLKQVLVNLLSNAVKFTPPGGSVGLVARVDESRGEVRVEVSDTGPGISPEDRRRLFRPFVQLDARLAREHSGTGLGLVLADRLVALHGGRIELESEPGQGSRFTVVLPWVRREVEPTPTRRESAGWRLPLPTPDSGQAGALVLLVEDDDTQRSLFAEALRVYGFRVELARNGAEALDKAARIEPDVVVMDVQMPGMDGLEATRRLKATPSLRSTPVVALTALVMPGDRERCRAAGVDEYLSKPIALGDLARAVGRLARPAQS